MACPNSATLAVIAAFLIFNAHAQELNAVIEIPQQTHEPAASQTTHNHTEAMTIHSHAEAMMKLDMNDPVIQGAFGEMNIGQDLFEGDIKLTPSQRDWITKSQRDSQTRALVKSEHRLWDNKVVPYVISDDLRDESKDFVESAIEEWKNHTCINLREKEEGDSDYIEFVYEGGCSSYVGKIGGKQTISVGSDSGTTCRHGNIVHEIAHSLGYFHEHSRPDRDDYIQVKWSNIMPGYQKNFVKENLQTVDSRGVAYDYDSVMHYGAYFFTNGDGDERPKTIVTLNGDHSIGQRVGLSEKDIQQARLLYSCDEEESDDQIMNAKATLRNRVKSKKTHAASKKSNSKYTNPLIRKAKKRFAKKSTKAGHHQLAKKAARKMVITKEKTAKYQGNFGFNENWTKGPISDPGALEMNIGKHFFEGDIRLTQKQRDFIEKSRRKDKHTNTRAIVRGYEDLWPDGIVPYTVDSDLRPESKNSIESALREWREKVPCLTFRKKTDSDQDYVRFTYEGGCSSNVGRVGGEQTISVGDAARIESCKHGNIVHEIAHVVGFFHEHSRPDRDKYIKISWDNIMPDMVDNFIAETPEEVDSRGVGYDYESVTHYGAHFFSKDNFAKTIETPHGEAIGQRHKLSDCDALQAKLLYKCKVQKGENPECKIRPKRLYSEETYKH
ncbi:uncharacterized protein LOC5521463 isoform X2 [Nematostella vectensis]|uniref:uncharacterized protein LOC5521463 isoform X2 n=1 Tax=Nematostella vectensis TaxID=45351 RepID=UPI002077558E|nr:uncharacterized protein LOC5521463 isoform X2 [Nematostella vectensis]